MRRRRITSLDDPAFGRLFTGVRKSWRRLETLQTYDVGYERDEYEAFLRGEPLDTTWGPWEEMIAAHVAAGRSLRRVHVVEIPPTDYVRYELSYYQVSSAAGEEVRLIPVKPGQFPAGVLRHDDWIFDGREVWRMTYASGGRFLHATRRNWDLRRVLRSWETAWRQSVPLASVTDSLQRTP